ncbi:hypothetical protein F5B20DRAFT_588536 [Whalleya microplaca]|nr:hypothetical protein F5B20DRAFT_588536 [Whalleya microplaca]
MASLQAVLIAVCLCSGAVRAAAIDSAPVTALVSPRDIDWADRMKKMQYPPNDKVCTMVKNREDKIWQKSKASDFFSTWFQNNGNKLSDWVQKMHKTATKRGITPGDLDCTVLHSENCSPPQDDLERSLNNNDKIVRVIHTQVTNLYSILQAMDISAIKQTLLDSLDIGTLISDFTKKSDLDNKKKKLSIAAVSMWILSGILAITGLGAPIGISLGSATIVGSLTALTAGTSVGAFVANTAGGVISIMSQTRTDKGAIDVDKLDTQLSSKLGDYFEDISDRNAALTSKLFGGKPKEDINLMDFVSRVDDLYKNINPAHDWEPIMYLFQNGAFMTQPKTTDIIRPMFDAGFKFMKVGLVGFLFNVRKFYVMHFTDVDERHCKNKFDDAGRYVDKGCYVLKIGGKCLNHDDNAPTELKRAEQKYHMNVAEFFRNVRNCNNNKEMIDNKSYSLDKLGHITNCFYPLNYLKAKTPDLLHEIDHKVADQLGLKYPKNKNQKQSC